MHTVPIKIVRVNRRLDYLESAYPLGVPIPEYCSSGASGMDLYADIGYSVSDRHGIIIEPGDIVKVPTGFCVEIPEGFEIQIRSRSGLAINHGIVVVNSPGTIDSDYRGEIMVGLINLSKESYKVIRGSRIAQAVLAPVCHAKFEFVTSLEDTDRGAGGFGHTGI